MDARPTEIPLLPTEAAAKAMYEDVTGGADDDDSPSWEKVRAARRPAYHTWMRRAGMALKAASCTPYLDEDIETFVAGYEERLRGERERASQLADALTEISQRLEKGEDGAAYAVAIGALKALAAGVGSSTQAPVPTEAERIRAMAHACWDCENRGIPLEDRFAPMLAAADAVVSSTQPRTPTMTFPEIYGPPPDTTATTSSTAESVSSRAAKETL